MRAPSLSQLPRRFGEVRGDDGWKPFSKGSWTAGSVRRGALHDMRRSTFSRMLREDLNSFVFVLTFVLEERDQN
jgi:hypothetical protein